MIASNPWTLKSVIVSLTEDNISVEIKIYDQFQKLPRSGNNFSQHLSLKKLVKNLTQIKHSNQNNLHRQHWNPKSLIRHFLADNRWIFMKQLMRFTEKLKIRKLLHHAREHPCLCHCTGWTTMIIYDKWLQRYEERSKDDKRFHKYC